MSADKLNTDKMKEARVKLDKAKENLDKTEKEARKKYEEIVAAAKKEVDDLQKSYIEVQKESKEEWEKAGYVVIEESDPAVQVKRYTFTYPDGRSHTFKYPSLQDLYDLNIPLWLSPLWQRGHQPTDPPYKQTHHRWHSHSNNRLR